MMALSELKGLGKARIETLNKAGIYTMADLLLTLPVRYQDTSTITPLSEIAPGGEVIQRTVVSSTTGLSSFDSRILNEIGKWTWSKVKSGNVTVSFPLTFYSA